MALATRQNLCAEILAWRTPAYFVCYFKHVYGAAETPAASRPRRSADPKLKLCRRVLRPEPRDRHVRDIVGPRDLDQRLLAARQPRQRFALLVLAELWRRGV